MKKRGFVGFILEIIGALSVISLIFGGYQYRRDAKFKTSVDSGVDSIEEDAQKAQKGVVELAKVARDAFGAKVQDHKDKKRNAEYKDIPSSDK